MAASVPNARYAARRVRLLVAIILPIFALGCASTRPGSPLPRRGDEIMVCGQLFHTGAPVVLWTDPGGYDAYRIERRFVPWDKASWDATAVEKKLKTPERFGLRYGNVPPVPPTAASAVGAPAANGGSPLSPADLDRVRGGGWDLPTLQRVVDQFVLHYDAAGTSRACFRTLHDVRGLSVHFMLDLDGTIYQTLDVKERAWHATIANDRSVGIEIANIGAYPLKDAAVLDRWYSRDASGRATIALPPEIDGGERTPGPFHPARNEPVVGLIQGQELRQYDLTPQQYDSLAKLTAALCTVLPQIRCDYPRDASGRLITRTLTPEQLAAFKGVLGHYHIQENKTDPGPALDWDRVIEGARRPMR